MSHSPHLTINFNTNRAIRLKQLRHALIAGLIIAVGIAESTLALAATQTEQIFLSGKGPKDAVPWEFMVTGGRRANEQTTIPVPSVWEQHGFGSYNYGDDKSPHANEHGLYKLKFTPPAAWKDQRVRIVFDGAMTDTTVKVNGVQVGPTHQGGFSRFSYDITKTVKLGAENILEVDVAKESSNVDANKGERYADYWIFGGIFRPVWLEASPNEAIDHVAINAKADGNLTADVKIGALRFPVRIESAKQTANRVEAQVVTLKGEAVGQPFSASIPAGGGSPVHLSTKIDSPKLWNAETPNLYALKLSLYRGNDLVHTTTEKFGFRTFEVRPGQGFYVNGQRILLKGVNRHSFRPETGRALDREQNYEDARLIKTMNMNTARMSHYPPDPAFLEAADELGLYVINEVTGWQHPHDSFLGRLLIRELVERDVNHPSVVLWDNGNEGGWNRDLDGEFSLYDPQKRRVLHPWELHDDVDTKHYPSYPELAKRLAQPHVVLPTEILHALYDGGGGAGLEDYWKAITTSPVGGGAIIWLLADEGIARTDRNNALDIFGTYAPDGVVGPHFEKEGSYYTIRDLWSPVQIETPDLANFDGTLRLSNHYDFTSLAQTSYTWKLVRFATPQAKSTAVKVLDSGKAAGPNIAAHTSGSLKLNLPQSFAKALAAADALVLTANGPANEELWTWTWPVASPVLPVATKGSKPSVDKTAEAVRLSVGSVTASFDPETGLLRALKQGKNIAPITYGPRLTYAKPTKLKIPDPYYPAPVDPNEKPFKMEWITLDPQPKVHLLDKPQWINVAKIALDYVKTDSYGKFKFEVSSDNKTWKTIFDSTRRGYDGENYVFPPQLVSAIRLSQAVSDAGRQIPFKAVALGFEGDRFPPATEQKALISTGQTDEEAWLEVAGNGSFDQLKWTLRRDGSLKLDYSYNLTGNYIYHGITFDQPQDGLKSVKRLGNGPSRVWQNRLRGTGLTVSETPYHVHRPEAPFPEFQGYFSDLRWAQFNSTNGALLINNGTPDVYLRIGTPLLGHGTVDVDFPAGDLSFLAAIPSIGSKVVTAENTGPSSQAAKASGVYKGSLLFSVPGK